MGLIFPDFCSLATASPYSPGAGYVSSYKAVIKLRLGKCGLHLLYNGAKREKKKKRKRVQVTYLGSCRCKKARRLNKDRGAGKQPFKAELNGASFGHCITHVSRAPVPLN